MVQPTPETLHEDSGQPVAHPFWDLFEAKLVASIQRDPAGYALRADQTPADYAAKTRAKMQRAGATSCNLNSPTFRAVARALGIKPTRAALIAAAGL